MYWSLIKFADVFKVWVLAEIYRKFSKICSVNFKTAIYTSKNLPNLTTNSSVNLA